MKQNKAEKSLRKDTNPFVAILFAIGTSIIGPLPFALFAMHAPMSSFQGQLVSTIAFTGWSFCIFLWLKFYENKTFGTLGFPSKHGIQNFVQGGLIGVLFSAIIVGANLLIGQATLVNFRPSSILPSLVLLIGFIMQGSTEEIVYRGFLMQRFIPKWGVGISLIVQAVLFTLLHLGNGGLTVLPAANMLLVSIFLGVWAYKAGNLWGVCGFHALWNWAQGNVWGANVSNLVMDTKIVQFIPREDAISALTGGTFGLEGSILLAALFVLGIIYLLQKKFH